MASSFSRWILGCDELANSGKDDRPNNSERLLAINFESPISRLSESTLLVESGVGGNGPMLSGYRRERPDDYLPSYFPD
jgi:hypothetical protein